MVHPYIRQSNNCREVLGNADTVAARVATLLDRLHGIVIGPGLGRDELMQESAWKIIIEARKRKLPIVIDAVCIYTVFTRAVGGAGRFANIWMIGRIISGA